MKIFVSQLKKLKQKDQKAFENLILQLDQGNIYKKFFIILLINSAFLRILQKIPVLSGLIATANSLVVGHIENAKLELNRDIPPINVDKAYTSSELLETSVVDVLIIGSGPGAACAAAKELEIGTESVVVIERGLPPRTPHGLHHSLTHVTRDFYQAGQELILASGLPLFAQGNVFGGGSEINSGLFHNLPEKYIAKYSDAFGIEEKVWRKHEQSTSDILNPVVMNVLSEFSLLARGSQEIGLTVSNIPRWRTYFNNGDFEHRGMNLTHWSKLASNSHLKMYTCVEAIKIDASNPKYVSILVKESKTGNIKTIKAKRVHVSGGPISTPALLAKSRLINWKDTRFSWHPMIRVVASTKNTDLGLGDIDPFQSWTPDRSLKFGSAVSTAPLLAIALGREVDNREIQGLRSYYVTYSSSGRGGILPILNMPWYRFSKKDRENSRDGIKMIKEIIKAGGGEVINEEKLNINKQSTVHIFGTLPINSKVFTPGTNQLKKDCRIRVSDGSILPFGPGVNPQGVIMTAVSIMNRGLQNE